MNTYLIIKSLNSVSSVKKQKKAAERITTKKLQRVILILENKETHYNYINAALDSLYNLLMNYNNINCKNIDIFKNKYLDLMFISIMRNYSDQEIYRAKIEIIKQLEKIINKQLPKQNRRIDIY